MEYPRVAKPSDLLENYMVCVLEQCWNETGRVGIQELNVTLLEYTFAKICNM